MDELNNAGNELNIVVLDACRDNPFPWNRGASRGLVVVEHQPANSIIAFACAAGSVAADGTGRNGLYTTYFLNNLKTPGISVHDLFIKTGADVDKASGGQQRPAFYNLFNGLAYLGSRPSPNPNPNPNPNPIPVGSLYEQLVNATGTSTITVTQDTTLSSDVTISKALSITLRGDTVGRTVSGTEGISIERGVTLTLENITLKGICVRIKEGGTLVMNNASTITGCNSSGVDVNGTFIMNGGRITNNNGVFVGGVYVSGGTFIMKNGRIENNFGEFSAGGVYVNNKGGFYMQGGFIASNKTISGWGGGVLASQGTTFRMTGGTIYGSNGGSNANSGTRGNAVYDLSGEFFVNGHNRTISR